MLYTYVLLLKLNIVNIVRNATRVHVLSPHYLHMSWV